MDGLDNRYSAAWYSLKKEPVEINENPRLKHVVNEAVLVFCPECTQVLYYEGRCPLCHNCGWSKCL